MLSNCDAGEDSWESPLDCKEIQPVHPKGNQSWIYIGRTDAEGETPILWPPDVKWLIGKDPDAGKDWQLEEKRWQRMRWYHWLNGCEFEQTSWDSEGQGSLVLQSMGLQRVRHDWAKKQQQHTNYVLGYLLSSINIFFPFNNFLMFFLTYQ